MKTNKTIIACMLMLSSLAVIAGVVAMTPNAQAAAGNCYQFASKQCISNISYWYDSCGNIQALNQNCNKTNQACSAGVCVNKTGVNYGGTTTTQNPPAYTGAGYIQNYRTNCNNGNIYWYSSQNTVQGIYQSCQDANSCTLDGCQDNACTSRLVCDGSTCAPNSADYAKYCAGNIASQPSTTTNNTTNNTTTVINAGENQNQQLAVSVFGKKQGNADWSKNINVANNETVEFLLVVKNTSASAMTGVLASADITANISYTGNLKIDGLASAGSVVSGIDLGAFPANTSKAITFTGQVQSTGNQTMQVVARASSNGAANSDFLNINLNAPASATIAGASTAAVSAGTGFFDFIKKWYLWIIIIIVLIVLFIIIFRRLSSN